MSIIYKATNIINGKSYIGYSSMSLEYRKRGHICKSNHTKPKAKFHCAIKKYGQENFEWSVLINENATKDDEIRLIAEYNTYLKGYNLTRGGEGRVGMIESEETKALRLSRMHITREKCRVASTGRKHTEETLRKQREKLSTPEAKEKMKLARMKWKPESTNKMAKSLQKRVIVGGVVYESHAEAAKAHNISVPTLTYWKKTGKAQSA